MTLVILERMEEVRKQRGDIHGTFHTMLLLSSA